MSVSVLSMCRGLGKRCCACGEQLAHISAEDPHTSVLALSRPSPSLKPLNLSLLAQAISAFQTDPRTSVPVQSRLNPNIKALSLPLNP